MDLGAGRWRLTTSPQDFLSQASGYLAADPVVSTVVAGIAHHAVTAEAAGQERPAWAWYATWVEAGRVTGVAMRTADFGVRPLFVLPMPDEAAPGLARLLHGRGEEVRGVNGALPAALLMAEETARLAGGSVQVVQHTRLFEAGDVVAPRPAPGMLDAPAEGELGLVASWCAEFGREADRQAGRETDTDLHGTPDLDEVAHRWRHDRWRLWRDGAGDPVSLVGTTEPAFGVVRLGPVYTPGDRRGRGYAGNAVAGVTRDLLAAGRRACLFTDQANPVSNALYTRLGYRALVDMATVQVAPTGQVPG